MLDVATKIEIRILNKYFTDNRWTINPIENKGNIKKKKIVHTKSASVNCSTGVASRSSNPNVDAGDGIGVVSME